MWDRFRGVVADTMPQARGLPSDIGAYLAAVDDSYTEDAYHSLSIEGYRVSPEFVDRVRAGTWDPDADRGGYSWTVVRVEDRQAYMEALEHASVQQTIEPFTKFITKCIAGTASGAGCR